MKIIESWQPIPCGECGARAGQRCRDLPSWRVHATRVRAIGFACKFYAETMGYEPARYVEPTDAALDECFRRVLGPVTSRPSNDEVRAAFVAWAALRGEPERPAV